VNKLVAEAAVQAVAHERVASCRAPGVDAPRIGEHLGLGSLVRLGLVNAWRAYVNVTVGDRQEERVSALECGAFDGCRLDHGTTGVRKLVNNQLVPIN
jgi:hypothetical protein